MKLIKRLAIATGVLLALLAAVPFLFTLDDYRPQIEQAVSARINEPVTITRLRLVMLPMPYLSIEGVAVGKDQDLVVGRVRVKPDLWSLIYPVKVVKSIEIERLVVTQQALDRISAWTSSAAAPDSTPKPPYVRVHSIRLTDATLKLNKLTFGPFDASATLDAAGEPEHMEFNTRDGKLTISIRPQGTHFLVDAVAKSWQLPLGPPIVFDRIDVRGAATKERMSLGDIRAQLYGASVVGRADIGWQKGIKLKGEATIRGLDLARFVPVVHPGAKVGGQLDAKPAFSADARNAGGLGDALQLTAPFQIRKGVLKGVDIEKAATSFTKEAALGGETRFQQLSGQLALDHGAYRFTDIKIASGSLGATGHVSISREEALSGRINAELKSLAGHTVPLNVSGTIKSPLLFPTASYLAGAAAGTAVLGPGLGTTVGAQIGSWADRLFGGEKADGAE